MEVELILMLTLADQSTRPKFSPHFRFLRNIDLLILRNIKSIIMFHNVMEHLNLHNLIIIQHK